MKRLNHWLVCLDLTKMDDILAGYVKFLTSVINPETITFFHAVESSATVREMVKIFPELKSKKDFKEVIGSEIQNKIDTYFGDSSADTRLILREGRPTDQIIRVMKEISPDLLVIGKKTGYKGEGVIARRIVKYVSASILFVPETSRYNLENVLVPTDFSEQSAKAIEAAFLLTESQNGSVTAQHIFKYPAQFFPYMPGDEEKKKIDAHLTEKKERFLSEYDLNNRMQFVLTLHKEGKPADSIYDQVVRDQADLIVVASKSNKKMAGFLRDDFTDKMTYYSFGIPLLILKNKEKHQKFLQSVFQP